MEGENKSGENYFACHAYHHPNSDIETFTDYLQGSLSTPAILNKKVFILVKSLRKTWMDTYINV